MYADITEAWKPSPIQSQMRDLEKVYLDQLYRNSPVDPPFLDKQREQYDIRERKGTHIEDIQKELEENDGKDEYVSKKNPNPVAESRRSNTTDSSGDEYLRVNKKNKKNKSDKSKYSFGKDELANMNTNVKYKDSDTNSIYSKSSLGSTNSNNSIKNSIKDSFMVEELGSDSLDGVLYKKYGSKKALLKDGSRSREPSASQSNPNIPKIGSINNKDLQEHFAAYLPVSPYEPPPWDFYKNQNRYKKEKYMNKTDADNNDGDLSPGELHCSQVMNHISGCKLCQKLLNLDKKDTKVETPPPTNIGSSIMNSINGQYKKRDMKEILIIVLLGIFILFVLDIVVRLGKK